MSKKRTFDTYAADAGLKDLNARHPSKTTVTIVPPYQAPPSKTLYRSPGYPPALPELPPHLAQAPFKHTSTNAARKRENIIDYEHLEFLGDAYLETIATRLIYTRFPELRVGRQSALREKLVQNKTLAGYARMYGFEKKIEANGMELATDKVKEKILGDMIEVSSIYSICWKPGNFISRPQHTFTNESQAYVGALVLSEWDYVAPEHGLHTTASTPTAGFERAEAWLTSLWVPILLEEDPNIAVVVNRKEELATAIGDKGIKIEYKEDKPMSLAQGGAMQQYTVGVYITGWGLDHVRIGQGVGVGKKEAGSRAAADALDHCPRMMELKERKRVSVAERRARTESSRER